MPKDDPAFAELVASVAKFAAAKAQQLEDVRKEVVARDVLLRDRTNRLEKQIAARDVLLKDALCRLEKQHQELNQVEKENALLKSEIKLFRAAVERGGRGREET
jgi:peptidoglycan hydrolase CwlO-like protein